MGVTFATLLVSPVSALVIGVTVLLAGGAALAAVARSLPEARLVNAAGGQPARLPRCVGSTRRRATDLVRRVRNARPAPIPATHVAAWCDALSRRLRAGDTLRTALESEQPDHRALLVRTDSLRRTLRHGVSVAEAVMAVTPNTSTAHEGRDPHLELLCSVIAATADFGGSAAAPIDRVGATLRLRSADGQERSAQSAQARLSAHVLTVVPLAVLALLVATDRDVRHFSSGGLGLAVVSCGLALNLTGWSWMKRVVANGAS